MGDDFWDKLTSWTTALWTFVAINAVALFRAWPAIMGRTNEAKRDAASSADALLGHYESRIAHLEKRDKECQKELAEVLRRLAKLDGYAEGQGQAASELQIRLSAERNPKTGESA